MPGSFPHANAVLSKSNLSKVTQACMLYLSYYYTPKLSCSKPDFSTKIAQLKMGTTELSFSCSFRFPTGKPSKHVPSTVIVRKEGNTNIAGMTQGKYKFPAPVLIFSPYLFVLRICLCFFLRPVAKPDHHLLL